jgi:hypothetical protein
MRVSLPIILKDTNPLAEVESERRSGAAYGSQGVDSACAHSSLRRDTG